MDFVEFEESEIMFSDYSSDQSVESDESERDDRMFKHNNIESDGSKMMLKKRKSLKKMQKISSSLPIHIPVSGNNSLRYDSDVASFEPFDHVDFDDEDDVMMRLPPHLIVDRRRANRELARSFPLKERNLYRIRNCILIMNDEIS